jgi:hypothetical protein
MIAAITFFEIVAAIVGWLRKEEALERKTLTGPLGGWLLTFGKLS